MTKEEVLKAATRVLLKQYGKERSDEGDVCQWVFDRLTMEKLLPRELEDGYDPEFGYQFLCCPNCYLEFFEESDIKGLKECPKCGQKIKETKWRFKK